MTTPTRNTRSLAAVAGGAAFAFCGAIQATQDFGGTHNTIDSTAEYLVTGALPVALALTIPMYHLFGRLAGAPRAALAAMGAQAVLALMCVISVINGADASFFNAVAPVCLLTWLGGSVVLTRGLRRTGAVPAPVAFALPALLIATFMLSPIGGAMLTGAYWIAVGTLLHRGAIARPAVAVPAAA
jgi:hypothetical protein